MKTIPRLKFNQLPENLKPIATAKALHVGFTESEISKLFFKVVENKIVAFSETNIPN
jgi:hypothetical protein